MPQQRQRSLLETFQELGWQKWPIVVFAIISFVTTATGIVALLPGAVPWSVGWLLVGLPLSFAIQWSMLGSAMEIAREGVRWRWLVFYALAAVFSISFSYIAMYKLLVEDAFAVQESEQQQQLFEDYRLNTLADLEKARLALDVALTEVDSWMDAETRVGRTGDVERVSRYLGSLLREIGFDTSSDQLTGGRGRVHARWMTVKNVLTGKRQQIEEWKELSLLKEVSEGDVNLLTRARQIEANLSREAVNEILEGEGYQPLVERIPEGLESAFERPEDKRTSELILISNAWNDLGKRSSDPLIRAAAFAALFFDVVALLLAMTSVRTASEAVVKDRVTDLLVELAALNSSAHKAAFVLSQRIHSRGRLVDRWFLDMEDIKTMGQLERLIVARLEGLGLMRAQWLRKRMSVASAARGALRQAGLSQAATHQSSAKRLG